MKKKIFALIALAAAFIGCSKEASETPSPAAEGQKFVITASVGDPATRLGYVENDQNGFNAKFTSSEKISLYFLKADNSVALSRVLNIDGYSISDDGRTAKFETTDLAIPTDAVKLAAYLYSGSGSAYSEEKATTDLSLQANLSAAQSHHILYAALNTSDIKVDANGVSTANIKFAYKTALLRFTLTFPEDVKVTMDDKTVITLSSTDNAVHSVLDVVWGELAETSSQGDIVFYPTDTLGKKNVAVAYACVWAGDNFKNTKLSVAQGDDTYSVDLQLKKETLEAGKVYDVTRTLMAAPKPVAMWANDDAASVDFKYSGGEDVTNDWLSCKAGKVSWTANATGAPRHGKLDFKNGATFELTQVNPTDLKGEWTLYSKRFNPGGTVPGSNDSKAAENVANATKVTFGQPLGGETLKDDAGVEHTNIYGIKGLFLDAVMDAAAEIDYAAMTLKLGVFFDRRKAQDAGNGVHMAYLPECAKSNTWANYLFAPGAGTFSANDYDWLWFTTTDLKTLKYVFAGAGQQTGNKGYYICGISCVKAKSADASTLNVGTTSGYDAIYQANYNGSNTDGMYFAR